MTERALVELGSVVVLGIAAQWLAWRLRFPSILFLLVLGFVAGPVMGFLHPDELLGDVFMPVVSISVAVILFEGGLTLRISELQEIGRVVVLLITAGLAVTWAVGSAAAYLLLGLSPQLSVLLGAILVVTGPTVIGPLLRHIRPVGRVADVLKWEGIVIDPVGALLAVLVFEAIVVGEVQQAGTLVLLGIVKTVLFGGGVGFLAAVTLLFLLKRYWIPDFLHEAAALMFVVAAFVTSNLLQPESGLLAATLMGLAMDNRKQVNIRHIVEFKENLRVLIISSLFILLAARLDPADVDRITLSSLIFLGVMIVVARPAAVLVSTIGSRLGWRERAFIAALAPRGIVAAAVSSVFALRLSEMGVAEAESLVPITFLVIVGTVAIYGLTSSPLARWLKVAEASPQGALIVGAHAWARDIARALRDRGFRAVMVDTNRANIVRARLEGIDSYHGSALAEHLLDEVSLDGIGRLLAMTPNDEANALAVLHLGGVFESENLYRLRFQGKKPSEGGPSRERMRGRLLFGEDVGFLDLDGRYNAGWRIKTTNLTDEFDLSDYQAHYAGSAVVLFSISEAGRLTVAAADGKLEPKPGQAVIALVKEADATVGRGV